MASDASQADGERALAGIGRGPDGAALALACCLRLIGQVLGLATPVAMLLVVDRVVASGSRQTLGALVAGVLLLTLFQYLFLAAAGLAGAAEVERRALPVRRRLLAALLDSQAAPRWASAGWEVAQQVLDACRFLVETRTQAMADAVFVLLLAALLLAFSPGLSAVVLGFVPAYLAVGAAGSRLAHRHAERATAGRAGLASRFLEAAGAGETVRTLNLADALTAAWAGADAALAVARYRVALAQRLTALGVELLQRLSLLLVMLLGVSAVIGGALTLGQYIAFNLLAMQLAQPLLRLAAYRRARADHDLCDSGRRALLATCAEAPWPRSAAGPAARPVSVGPALLEARALVPARAVAAGHAGPGGIIDFSVRGGQWLGVSGPSGCGKSTLLRVLSGLARPASGEVLLDGVPVERWTRSERARRVRLVPQHPVVFAATVAENIGLGAAGAGPLEIAAAAEVCGLMTVARRLPEHLNTSVGAGGWALSGGERARLCIARASVGRPAVLLLDEVTSALDAAAEAALLARLRLWLPDTVFIVVSHRTASLARCDRWLRLGPPSGHAAAGG